MVMYVSVYVCVIVSVEIHIYIYMYIYTHTQICIVHISTYRLQESHIRHNTCAHGFPNLFCSSSLPIPLNCMIFIAGSKASAHENTSNANLKLSENKSQQCVVSRMQTKSIQRIVGIPISERIRPMQVHPRSLGGKREIYTI